MKVKKKKVKSVVEHIQGIRREWTINPKTRIQENELKNKKKRRQEEKKITIDDH